MGIETIIGEAGKALLESEITPKQGAEFFKKDAEVLAGLGELKTPKLTEKITEHLVQEGRPGSAEYINVFSKSSLLDKELRLVETEMFDAQNMETIGLPLMIDTQRTTPEMVLGGHAVLTPEAQADILGTLNTLSYKLEQHVGKTAQVASEYYAEEFSKEQGIADKIRAALGVKPEPFEIPFTPNKVEIARLNELSKLKYLTKGEIQQTFQRELHFMMRQRPGVIGLELADSASSYFAGIAQGLGYSSGGEVNIERIRDAYKIMAYPATAVELQIYPEFFTRIEDRIERDFSQISTTKTFDQE